MHCSFRLRKIALVTRLPVTFVRALIGWMEAALAIITFCILFSLVYKLSESINLDIRRFDMHALRQFG
jgi:hypothetical protein